MFKSGFEARKSLTIAKGQTVDLWFHNNYTVEQFIELSYKSGLEKITIRHDSGGYTIIESKNNILFGVDLIDLNNCRIFTNAIEAEKSWLFLLDGIRGQFKKIMKAQGFVSRKKNPEKYI